MYKYKEEALRFLGVAAWHEAGFTGEGIKIMSDEKVSKEKYSDVISPGGYKAERGHGDDVVAHIKLIAPKAVVIAFPLTVNSDRKGGYISPCAEYIKSEGVNIFTTSSTSNTISSHKESAMKDCISGGCLFFAAAGNEGSKGLKGEAKSEQYFAIGGVKPRYNSKKEEYDWDDLGKTTYSSKGKELDFVMIAEILGVAGTSFCAPVFAAMCGLVQEYFIKKAGRQLTRQEMIAFIGDNLIDTQEEGFDIETGHGLFVLPKPETIDVYKYIPAEKGEQVEKDEQVGEVENMSKKVFIGVGHGGSDSGAVANGLKEKDMNLTMALACREELERHGVEVLLSRYKDEIDRLTDVIEECNAFAPNLAIDIHNNAGGGDGFEVYHHSGGGTSKTMAQNINNEVVKIGQNSRGLKIKVNASGVDYYGFIRETAAPAVIVEGVFLDNKKDIQIADTEAEQKAFGVAYAKGILTTLGIGYVDKVDKIYRVQVGAYKVKDNAEKMAERLRASGFDTIIKED